MAKVILETIQRGVHRYHKIDSFPVTVGRAFDNDIILQDVTISPHHLVITDDNDGYQINNLTDENGTKINHKKIYNCSYMFYNPLSKLYRSILWQV